MNDVARKVYRRQHIPTHHVASGFLLFTAAATSLSLLAVVGHTASAVADIESLKAIGTNDPAAIRAAGE